jgi:hypothetical protein
MCFASARTCLTSTTAPFAFQASRSAPRSTPANIEGNPSRVSRDALRVGVHVPDIGVFALPLPRRRLRPTQICAVATEKMGGRLSATRCHESPSFAEPKSLPVLVPK